MLYVKLALIELALLNLMISLDPLRVLRTLRYTPRRGWNGSYASNISIVINNNDYKRKELARLEGSFPSDYIKDIINKLEKE